MYITKKIANANTKLCNYLTFSYRRSKLKHKDFTIISNNCWGGLVYQYFGLPYNSPTVGLFIMDDDYIKFLENFDYYISQSLIFIPFEASRYHNYLTRESTAKAYYPIAQLGNIEIHFLHYHSEEEACIKWERRCRRINQNRLLIKMSQRYIHTTDILERFALLPFRNKLCFTEQPFQPTSHVNGWNNFIYVEELKALNIQGGDETPYVKDKIDFIKLINEIK